jgi:hypothetical protein
MFLALIIGALVAVYRISEGPGLSQSAFVYSENISVGGRLITSFAPYSIIPTLIAVLVKLWWEVVEETFRRLTPFLAMVQGPRKPSDGAALSYITTPILWVTFVAAKKKHWLLALVTFGAFSAEVLQISFSGLWTREAGAIQHSADLQQTMQLRSLSHVFHYYLQTSGNGLQAIWPGIESQLYGGQSFYASWLWSALVENVYNGTPAAWSTGDWGFPPVDFSNLTNLPISQDIGSKVAKGANIGDSMNITLSSPVRP